MARGTRAMLAPVGLLLLLLAVGGGCEDTVAANVGRHTMSRIAELLSPSECRRLRRQLEGPDLDLGEQELEQLSEENNPIPPYNRRRRRDLRGPAGCSEVLQSWLETAGEVTTWDRLARGLRQVGRPDVARELGKNLNQDRSLELRRNVEEYGRTVRRLTSSLLLGSRRHGPVRDRRAPARDLGDLRFERRPPPPYTRSPLGWVGPVISGVLGGFLASVLFTVATMCSCRWALGLDMA
ncbi:transmembrane and death domain protein 1 [Athene noctua]|uniref:transmembrane and death domain protein 1 n=1 Tax=Athene noctua TaxID=126797 RepID=UPI003EB80862